MKLCSYRALITFQTLGFVAIVLILVLPGHPPAQAQGHFDPYTVPSVSHDGLVGALTHQNDVSNKLADDISTLQRQQQQTYQRLNTVEEGQTANTTEIRIWGGVLTALLGSGLLLQVSGRKRVSEVLKEVTKGS